MAKVFCSSCGAGYDEGVAYCPMCGISVSKQTVAAYNRAHQAHCTVCGAKSGPRDTYCATCGAECDEYIAQTGFGGPIFGGGASGGFAGQAGFSNVASGVKTLAPNLANQMKDRSVFAPALVFALVAVAVGIVLSFIIDGWIGNGVKQLLYAQVRGIVDGDMSFKLGPVTVWLLTCLGGLSGSVKIGGSGIFASAEAGGNASFALGIIVLTVVPIVALIVARFARRAFIGSQHPDKSVRVVDGLCAALMFGVINVILSFFPSALGNALSQAASSNSYDLVKISIGTRIIPLFLFSVIAAFIMAMPSIKELAGSVSAKNKTAGISCAAGASFARLTLLCGLISAFVMLVYGLIKSEVSLSDISAATGTSSLTVYFIVLAILLNLGLWLASFFTGGTFALSSSGRLLSSIGIGGFGTFSIGAMGIRMGGGSETWYGGILLLVAGLWIVVTVLYKLLRNEQLDLKKIIGVIAVPPVVMTIISSCATIGGRISAEGETGAISLTTASFENFLMCAVFMAAGVGVIYLVKKNQQLDNIVSKLATTPFACIATAVATLITCLTNKMF